MDKCYSVGTYPAQYVQKAQLFVPERDKCNSVGTYPDQYVRAQLFVPERDQCNSVGTYPDERMTIGFLSLKGTNDAADPVTFVAFQPNQPFRVKIRGPAFL
jgi:hypothetical protein